MWYGKVTNTKSMQMMPALSASVYKRAMHALYRTNSIDYIWLGSVFTQQTQINNGKMLRVQERMGGRKKAKKRTVIKN